MLKAKKPGYTRMQDWCFINQ